MNRRKFLFYTGVGGGGLALISVAERFRLERKTNRVHQTQNMMGTFASITAMDASKEKAEQAVALAFSEMHRVAQLLSRHQSDSALAVLNRDGQLSEAPPELLRMVRRGQDFFTETGGTFDLSINPLMALYETQAEEDGTPPSPAQVAKTMNLVGGDAISLHENRISLQREGMSLTLDGIAKGYVVECGAQVIRAHGIEHALINAGGDIRAVGTRSGSYPWRIAIQDPKSETGAVTHVMLNDGAIATSGDYEIFFDREKLNHHILDPQTGSSPRELSSVSVAADNTTDADALSTAVFVMGANRGQSFIEQRAGTECFLVRNDQTTLASSGWQNA